MTNLVRCTDCHTADTRGNMHVRSRAFEQVFFCVPCMAIKRRVAELVAYAHGWAA